MDPRLKFYRPSARTGLGQALHHPVAYIKAFSTTRLKTLEEWLSHVGIHFKIHVHRPTVRRQLEDYGHRTSTSIVAVFEKETPESRGRQRGTKVHVRPIDVVALLLRRSAYSEQGNGIHALAAETAAKTNSISSDTPDRRAWRKMNEFHCLLRCLTFW